MSDSDDHVSSLAFNSSNEHSSSGSLKELMKVLGQLQCYADELPAHLCDEEEDTEEDHNGLCPVVLRSRLEREVPSNKWLVFASILNP